MRIVHLALGGCLTYPRVQYGLTPDTGGHIAYILGAAFAQAARTDVSRVEIVTRAFDDPSLGFDHARLIQPLGAKLSILRLETDDPRYLEKEALAAERPALRRAFADLVRHMVPRPDVIHAHFADAVAVARDVAEDLRIPLIYTPHALGADKAAHHAGALCPALIARIAEERDALRRADGVIVSSRDEAERQIESYGIDVAGRTHRVCPGVTLPDGHSGTAAAASLIDLHLTSPDRPMILAIARPVRKKNLSGLMRAYLDDENLRNHANLVVLAGQRGEDVRQSTETADVLAELIEYAAEAPGRIALPARHDPEHVGQVYRLARMRRGIFVNPALHEPFGLTLLEAAQAGLPVVATREGGPADIVMTLENGTLVDPRDTGAIAHAIKRFVISDGRWTAASQAAAARIAQFDWSNWAAQVDHVYRTLRRPVVSRPKSRRLLVCDIDGTLTGCPDGAEAFASYCVEEDVTFAVATGRSIGEARRVLAAWSLPEPVAFITAVGTEIYRAGADDRLGLCANYARAMANGWDRDAVLDCLDRIAAQMQPPIEQRAWKLGCLGDAREADRIRNRLADLGMRAQVIPSHGTLIDILPPAGGKNRAVRHLTCKMGIAEGACIVAGDSGNDLDMLRSAQRAIVVGNALSELDVLPARPGLYRAEQHHANGVLEGLAHFGWVSRDVAVPA